MKTSPSNSPGASTLERIPHRWAWHHRTLLRLRQKLLHAQAAHTLTATAPAEPAGDLADSAEDEIEHAIILAELHGEAEQLAEVEAALQRIREGTYGTCTETGEPISAARLRAIPWTRYSRSAAERHEQRARQNRSG